MTCLFLLKSKWLDIVFSSRVGELIRACAFFFKYKWTISIHLKSKSMLVAPQQGEKMVSMKIYNAVSDTSLELYLLYNCFIRHESGPQISKNPQFSFCNFNEFFDFYTYFSWFCSLSADFFKLRLMSVHNIYNIILQNNQSRYWNMLFLNFITLKDF